MGASAVRVIGTTISEFDSADRRVGWQDSRAFLGRKHAFIQSAGLLNESGLVNCGIGLPELYDVAHLLCSPVYEELASISDFAFGCVGTSDAFVTLQTPLPVGTFGQPLGDADLRVDLTGSHRDARLITGGDDFLNA